MKHIRHYTATLLVGCLALFATSCDLETSGNGSLDGFWHLERVDTLSTGTALDLSTQRVFWAVQGKLLQVENSDNDNMYFFTFEHSGNKLTLSNARANDRTHSDPEVTDATVLAPFGINRIDEQFTVERLSDGHMVLATETLRLSFRKF